MYIKINSYFKNNITESIFYYLIQDLEQKAPKEAGGGSNFTICPDDPYEIISEKVIMFEILGEGAFGIVRKGWIPEHNKEVAVKMLKGNFCIRRFDHFHSSFWNLIWYFRRSFGRRSEAISTRNRHDEGGWISCTYSIFSRMLYLSFIDHDVDCRILHIGGFTKLFAVIDFINFVLK